MIRDFLLVASGLSVGYFIGFLLHHNELAAKKEATMRRLEEYKKVASEYDLDQVSGKKE